MGIYNYVKFRESLGTRSGNHLIKCFNYKYNIDNIIDEPNYHYYIVYHDMEHSDYCLGISIYNYQSGNVVSAYDVYKAAIDHRTILIEIENEKMIGYYVYDLKDTMVANNIYSHCINVKYICTDYAYTNDINHVVHIMNSEIMITQDYSMVNEYSMKAKVIKADKHIMNTYKCHDKTDALHMFIHTDYAMLDRARPVLRILFDELYNNTSVNTSYNDTSKFYYISSYGIISQAYIKNYKSINDVNTIHNIDFEYKHDNQHNYIDKLRRYTRNLYDILNIVN